MHFKKYVRECVCAFVYQTEPTGFQEPRLFHLYTQSQWVSSYLAYLTCTQVPGLSHLYTGTWPISPVHMYLAYLTCYTGTWPTSPVHTDRTHECPGT